MVATDPNWGCMHHGTLHPTLRDPKHVMSCWTFDQRVYEGKGKVALKRAFQLSLHSIFQLGKYNCGGCRGKKDSSEEENFTSFLFLLYFPQSFLTPAGKWGRGTALLSFRFSTGRGEDCEVGLRERGRWLWLELALLYSVPPSTFPHFSLGVENLLWTGATITINRGIYSISTPLNCPYSRHEKILLWAKLYTFHHKITGIFILFSQTEKNNCNCTMPSFNTWEAKRFNTRTRKPTIWRYLLFSFCLFSLLLVLLHIFSLSSFVM